LAVRKCSWHLGDLPYGTRIDVIASERTVEAIIIHGSFIVEVESGEHGEIIRIFPSIGADPIIIESNEASILGNLILDLVEGRLNIARRYIGSCTTADG
jgi:hypothetical protein